MRQRTGCENTRSSLLIIDIVDIYEASLTTLSCCSVSYKVGFFLSFSPFLCDRQERSSDSTVNPLWTSGRMWGLEWSRIKTSKQGSHHSDSVVGNPGWVYVAAVFGQPKHVEFNILCSHEIQKPVCDVINRTDILDISWPNITISHMEKIPFSSGGWYCVLVHKTEMTLKRLRHELQMWL